MKIKSQSILALTSSRPCSCKALQMLLFQAANGPALTLSFTLAAFPFAPLSSLGSICTSILWRPVCSCAISIASYQRSIHSQCEWLIMLNVQPSLGHCLFSKGRNFWVDFSQVESYWMDMQWAANEEGTVLHSKSRRSLWYPTMLHSPNYPVNRIEAFTKDSCMSHCRTLLSKQRLLYSNFFYWIKFIGLMLVNTLYKF